MADDIVIDTPAGIEHFRFAALIARLRIEVNTGMGFRGPSTLKIAKQLFQVTGTKRGVLAKLEDLYEETYGRRYGAVPSDGD